MCNFVRRKWPWHQEVRSVMQSDWLPYFWDFKSEKADVRKEQNLTPKTVYVRNPCCLYGSCYESRYVWKKWYRKEFVFENC